MEVDVKREIVAVVTLNADVVRGSAPTFIANDHEEREKIATSLSVILQGAIHDLGNGALVVVKH